METLLTVAQRDQIARQHGFVYLTTFSKEGVGFGKDRNNHWRMLN